MTTHINPATGEHGKCTATVKLCPYQNQGDLLGITTHFRTVKEAKLAGERLREESLGAFKTFNKNFIAEVNNGNDPVAAAVKALSLNDRILLAKSDNVAVEDLRVLATDEDIKVLQEVVMNKNTPEDVIEELIKGPNSDPSLRYYASVKTKNSALLEYLADDDVPVVRSGVMWNKNTPDRIVARLIKDADEPVVSTFAESTESEEVMNSIFDNFSDSERVVTALSRNKQLTAEILDGLFEASKNINWWNIDSHGINYDIVKHKNSSAKTLYKVLTEIEPDYIPFVVEDISKHQNCDNKTLKACLDKTQSVMSGYEVDKIIGTILENKNVDGTTIDYIVNNYHRRNPNILTKIREHPATPMKTLLKMADPDYLGVDE